MSRELDWTYYLAGSTGASVIWAFVTLFAMLLVVESVRDKQKAVLEEIKNKKLVYTTKFFFPFWMVVIFVFCTTSQSAK